MNSWYIIRSNKGALFGMDARIAMAIFASISVAIGYFAFGKIDMAKNSALLRELNAIHDAIQDYQSDMGTFYQFTIATSNGSNDFIALYDSSTISANFQGLWNGPYYQASSTSHLTYGSFTITYGQDDRSACTGSSECHAWITITQIPQKIWNEVNAFADENGGSTPEVNGHTIGRVQANALTNPRTLYYKSVSRKR
jgi:type II secretory pathway pseudopilin PulG